jgi:hypothetical protein
MNKVVLAVLVLGLIFSGLLFAADNYTVEKVTGKVEQEVSPGKWAAVKEGATLSGATVLNTGLNSNIILKIGDRKVTINAMKKGAIETLMGAGSSSGIKIGGKVSESNTSTSARGTSNISTASTRASDAAKDVDWAE